MFGNYIGASNPRFFGGLDADALAFLTAAGITDATITNAINRLVKNYKGLGDLNNSVNLWNVTDRIIPLVGGTLTKCGYDLKTATKLYDFFGGMGVNSNGITGNGTNSYAKTGFIPSAGGLNYTLNSARFGVYCRTNVQEDSWVMGAFSTGVLDISNLLLRSTTNQTSSFVNINNNAFVISNSDSRGWFCANRIDSLNSKIIINTAISSGLRTSVNLTNREFYLMARNANGSDANYVSTQAAFFIMGGGLSDANLLLERTIIQAFQTDLGRAV